MAPLHESVPPKYYGGTERVVSYITEALVRLGHDVTLFASGDSETKANLVPMCHRALRLDKHSIDQISHHVLMAEKVFQCAGNFDVIHNHYDYFPYSLARRSQTPTVTTLHGRLDLPDLIPLYEEFSDSPVVSISNSQRTPFPDINWQATIHHGLPKNFYTFREKPGSYLAFMGRICPEKRVDRAIEIAERVGMPLKIAAKVDKVDVEYFETTIKPLLKNPLVDYIGEIGEAEKDKFFGEAFALVFPIDWPEPFGLVMIESLACGTPVIAQLQGSVHEVIDEGITGFVVNSVEQSVESVKKIPSLSRKRCREVFDERFTDTRMAEDYLRIYEKLIREKKSGKC